MSTAKLKFASSPWRVESAKKQYYSSDTGLPTSKLEWKNILCGNLVLASVHELGSSESMEDIARLLCAAPEMLDELELVKRVLSNISPHELSPQPRKELSDLLNSVLITISKATGGAE